MSGPEDRKESRRQRGNLVDEIVNLQRGYVLAQVEGIAALTDVARQFLSEAADREPVSNKNTWGDVIRDLPDTMTEAADSTTESLSRIPRRMVDTFYAEYRGGEGRAPGGNPDRGPGPRKAPNPEAKIVGRTRAYLRQFPGGAALLKSAIENVALSTAFPEDMVKTTILRNFVTSGAVVRDSFLGDSASQENQVLSTMAATLSGLGYTDLRYDVALKAFPDMTQTAALAAFDEGNPIVICYPTDRAGVQDPVVRQSARFQAAALDPGHEAKFVWVSDGAHDYFYDVEQDRAVSSLPRMNSEG